MLACCMEFFEMCASAKRKGVCVYFMVYTDVYQL